MAEILVTEFYINSNYCLRPTGTAGTSQTKIASADWITTNYLCTVSGVNGNRCPSATEIFASVPNGITYSVTAGYSATVTCLISGYWTLSFTDNSLTYGYYDCGYGCTFYSNPPGCVACYLDNVSVTITNYCGVLVANETILTQVGTGSYTGNLSTTLQNGYNLQFNIESAY